MKVQYAMEPITHFLTGACIGRAGLNRRTAYATLAAVLAAEAADLDVFWGFAGPVEELKHHRGITHTFIAVPFVAAAAVGATWICHRWVERRRTRRMKSLPPPEAGAPPRPQPQPVRWLWVYLAALISALSHILLDWTNNYGVRPFFPFNPRLVCGQLRLHRRTGALDPLLSRSIVPGILGLAEREIRSRRTPISRPRLGHLRALRNVSRSGAFAMRNMSRPWPVGNNPITTDPVDRIAAEPYPMESVSLARDHRNAELLPVRRSRHSHRRRRKRPADRPLFKPPDTPAVEAAKQTASARSISTGAAGPSCRTLARSK